VKRIVMGLFVGALGAGGCSREALAVLADAATDSGDASAAGGFAQAVFPLLQALGCGECHSAENRVVRHWALTTAVETYAQWVNQYGFDHCDPSGQAIVAPQPVHLRVSPGDPDHSLVMKKLTDPWEMCGEFYGHMPPSPAPRLSAEQLDLIRAWIAGGAAL
jgi:hypothetical protein